RPKTSGGPFSPLGYDGDRYYYLPRGTEQVMHIRRGSHTSPAEMLGLAPLEYWEATGYVKDSGSVDWQAAASWCMRLCEHKGVYSTENIRGRGAWYDDGAAVMHLGNRLLVNGVSTK